MIRKSGNRFFLATNANAFSRRSCVKRVEKLQPGQLMGLLARRKAALERIRRHDRLGAGDKAIRSGGCGRWSRRISCGIGHGRLERRLGGSPLWVRLCRLLAWVGEPWVC